MCFGNQLAGISFAKVSHCQIRKAVVIRRRKGRSNKSAGFSIPKRSTSLHVDRVPLRSYVRCCRHQSIRDFDSSPYLTYARVTIHETVVVYFKWFRIHDSFDPFSEQVVVLNVQIILISQ